MQSLALCCMIDTEKSMGESVDWMEYIILVGIVILLVLVLVLLLRKPKTELTVPDNKEDLIRLQRDLERLSASLPEEFARSRQDAATGRAAMREDIDRALGQINARLEKAEKGNIEHELQLNRLLNNSLSELRDRNEQHAEKQTQKLEQSLTRLREENERKLEQMRETVSEKLDETLGKRLDASFETVSKQLENVYKSLGEMKELSAGVTDNVTALNRVLTNVKARGTWAEVQLKGILDQIIPGRYVENYSPKGTGSVEFAVIIPASNGKQTYLPLDSKFPMEDYIRITEAADAGDAAALKEARKALEARITQEAKDISTKYISVPDTTPFAILYLATEGLYAEAVSAGGGLMEKIHSTYGVLIAGPSTITALLNSLAMGFRTIAVNEKAEEIRVMLTAIKAQYEKFGVLLEKARKKVDEAGRTLEDAQKRNNQIQRKLKNVETMDAGAAENLLFDDALPALPETE